MYTILPCLYVVCVFDISTVDAPTSEGMVMILCSASLLPVQVDAMGIALAAQRLGAGRRVVEDVVDPAVGLTGLVKVGEYVTAAQPICIVHASDEEALADASAAIAAAVTIEQRAEAPVPTPLIARVLGATSGL